MGHCTEAVSYCPRTEVGLTLSGPRRSVKWSYFSPTETWEKSVESIIQIVHSSASNIRRSITKFISIKKTVCSSIIFRHTFPKFTKIVSKPGGNDTAGNKTWQIFSIGLFSFHCRSRSELFWAVYTSRRGRCHEERLHKLILQASKQQKLWRNLLIAIQTHGRKHYCTSSCRKYCPIFRGVSQCFTNMYIYVYSIHISLRGGFVQISELKNWGPSTKQTTFQALANAQFTKLW